MCRFAPQAFLQRMADGVGASRAAPDTRAVLRTLDLMLPEILTEQLHAELASIWGPLTIAEQAHPDVEGGLLVGQEPARYSKRFAGLAIE
jgi:hypothetical protein